LNTASPDPLAALRAATAQRHHVLDTSLPLAADEAGLDDYRQHLLMLRAWLAPVQAWLAAFDDGPQDGRLLPTSGYLRLIDADLADPAMASTASANVTFPDTAWPAHADAAYRWGVCYVVEGSQLGGAVLYKRLAGRLAPHPLAYLRGAPEGPGPRWKMFIAALREALADPAAVELACRGAVDAFDRLIALQARSHGPARAAASIS
jgi:heme oxygenase